MATAVRDRPDLPKGYISRRLKGMLDWADAERVLGLSRYYWIATTDRDGRPHLIQQWGAWVDGAFWFEGSDETRWARNLARDGRLGFGGQVGTRAVMAEATGEIVRRVDRAIAEQLAKRYSSKYGATFSYRPKPEQYLNGHAFRARPTKVILFDVKRFNTSATRFTFGADGRDRG